MGVIAAAEASGKAARDFAAYHTKREGDKMAKYQVVVKQMKEGVVTNVLEIVEGVGFTVRDDNTLILKGSDHKAVAAYMTGEWVSCTPMPETSED